MKITKKLPQFDKQIALLIVTGEQEAEFYVARGGEIVKYGSFRVPKPQYSDREDFSRGGGNPVFESGARFEARKRLRRREFSRLFKERLGLVKVDRRIDGVYLFCPATVRNEVTQLLPAELKKLLKKIIAGNYFKEHPFELLKKLETGK